MIATGAGGRAVGLAPCLRIASFVVGVTRGVIVPGRSSSSLGLRTEANPRPIMIVIMGQIKRFTILSNSVLVAANALKIFRCHPPRVVSMCVVSCDSFVRLGSEYTVVPDDFVVGVARGVLPI